MTGGRIYLFAGGGTGGHLYPGLAVAEALEGLDADARAVFVCSNRDVDRRILEPAGCAYVPQPVRPVPRSPRGWGRFLAAYLSSRRLAERLLKDLRPAAVLGLGGFAAGPMIAAAAKRGVPCGLLNPDAAVGLANRRLARRAGAIFVQHEGMEGEFPPAARTRVRLTGCPVRRGLLGADRREAIEHFSLDPARRTLLVVGGSLGAKSVNEAVLAAADRLGAFADAWQVLHVAGPDRAAAAREAWSRCPLPATVLEYCRRMDLALAAADLVVGRGGASSLAEWALARLPAVILPYPWHADRQQHKNARPLVEHGGATVLEDRVDPAVNGPALAEALEPLMGETTRLGAMAEAMGRCARPGAAAAVAGWLVEAARGR
jgi:UDP-N-acetylglucosamine--N-acetylmuramyl-(pentapeptide) pyrophosphoryl-undecaprenol N-acetylglucosamine transferase